MISGKLNGKISGSPSFVDTKNCGEYCQSFTENTNDSFQIGIGHYEDIKDIVIGHTKKYQAIILIDTDCINQDQEDSINHACPSYKSCFRPSYPIKKL